ncbi:hypothetical protein GCM10007874_39690 [Labrys miyagiensis]|uniref:Transglutaminase-like domain-containing protein n=1 Tax=Labrys miyagiensis TaxID=346912 RepID=A0ABQ6CRQ4_9HYPH|nr:transglutaminase-like domain-containing protein [Labrys miyagiensis]GLS20952.1 hypothetical protein GCM10007874_39690 [Labrys miyagiensis]
MHSLQFNDHYRNTSERLILDMLLLGGWAYELSNKEAIRETREALDRWISLGLGFKEKSGHRHFDPVEVINSMKIAGLAGHDTFWKTRYVLTGRRLVETLALEGELQTFELRYQRRFHIPSTGGKLRLRMPLPLDEEHLRTLSISPFIKGAGNVDLDIKPGRLEARTTASGAGTITIGAGLRLDARGRFGKKADRLDEKQADVYLRPREGLIVVSDRIDALAQTLVGQKRDTLEIAKAYWNYILDTQRCGSIHYDQVDVQAPCDWVLETGWCDCQLASALFIALCRARGIPARLVGGHLLYRLAPTNHYWAEFWLDDCGWMPVDFLSWDLSLGGRDIVWRDRFFTRVDQRMVTQVMPLAFTGAIGLPVPADFIIVQTACDRGIEIALSRADGTLVYTDELAFTA